MAVGATENRLRIASRPSDVPSLVDKIIESAKRVLVCQLTLTTAHDELLQLVEEYTGEHWTRWKT